MNSLIRKALPVTLGLMLAFGANRALAQNEQNGQTGSSIVLTLHCDDGRTMISRDGGQTWRTVDATSNDAVSTDANMEGTYATVGRGRSFAAPNPAASVTAITYTMKQTGEVTLTIFDIGGVEVKRLSAGMLGSGAHATTVDVSGLNDGTYYYRVSAGGAPVGGGILAVAH